MTIKIKYLPHAVGKLTRGSEQAAGWDLRAALKEPLTLLPCHSVSIPSGICVQLPFGKEAQVRSRSGLAYKYGVCILNGVGTIDADYRGEVGILLINQGETPLVINPGDRIAQMVIADVCMDDFEEVEELGETDRGQGGMGSTGI